MWSLDQECGQRFANDAALSLPGGREASRFCLVGFTHRTDHQLQIITRDDDVMFGLLQKRIPQGMVPSPRHQPGRSASLHPQHHLRNLPVPRRPDPQHPRRHLCRRPTCDENRRRREAPERPARSLAQPARPCRTCSRGCPRLPRPYPSDRRQGRRDPEKAHADQQQNVGTALFAHCALDSAVAEAYGWLADIAEDDALAGLFALNQARAAAGR